MLRSQTLIRSDQASGYLQKFCMHFTHSLNVECSDSQGVVTFPFGICKLRSEEGDLIMEIAANDLGNLEKLKSVTGSNLAKVALQEHLTVSWSDVEFAD